MDFWQIQNFIKDFPPEKSKKIIKGLFYVIALCIIWWILELILKDWSSSSDSAFRSITEDAIFVLLCFYWLTWLTDAAGDMEETKEDELDLEAKEDALSEKSKSSVLNLLVKLIGEWKSFKVEDLLSNKVFLEKLDDIFPTSKWDMDKISKRLRLCLRQLSKEWALKKMNRSSYKINSVSKKN